MSQRGKILGLVSVAVGMALVATACKGSSSSSNSSSGDLSGPITISGSSTVEPITSLVAEKFQGENTGVEPTVDGPGTSDGFVLFCKGETDINDASRQIDPEEDAACEAEGIDYVELEVALDGLSVIGNPSNPLDCLAIGDLYALFGPESSEFTNWQDADKLAKEVGGNDSFPDEDLVIVAPGEESGTYGSFIDLATKSIAEERKQPDDQLRVGYQSSGDDNVIVDNAEGTPGGLGFVGLSYAESAGSQVKLFGIDAGDGCVDPSSSTVIDGSYPLSRSLYIYVSKESLQSNPVVKPFVNYYLSEDGIASVGEVEYVELPQDRIEATRAAWDGAGASQASP